MILRKNSRTSPIIGEFSFTEDLSGPERRVSQSELLWNSCFYGCRASLPAFFPPPPSSSSRRCRPWSLCAANKPLLTNWQTREIFGANTRSTFNATVATDFQNSIESRQYNIEYSILRRWYHRSMADFYYFITTTSINFNRAQTVFDEEFGILFKFT